MGLHALSGGVAGLGTGILLHLAAPQVAALAGFTAGMALLADLDKCGSSPARCLSLLSRLDHVVALLGRRPDWRP
jgi:hypothetical protein